MQERRIDNHELDHYLMEIGPDIQCNKKVAILTGAGECSGQSNCRKALIRLFHHINATVTPKNVTLDILIPKETVFGYIKNTFVFVAYDQVLNVFEDI